jgi:hypothetical protein
MRGYFHSPLRLNGVVLCLKKSTWTILPYCSYKGQTFVGLQTAHLTLLGGVFSL